VACGNIVGLENTELRGNFAGHENIWPRGNVAVRANERT